MSAATTSTTFKYDTEVHIPGTALLNLAGDILDKYQKSRLQQFKEADRTDDEDARVDAGEFLVDCQQAQWLIDRERYRANLADNASDESRGPDLSVQQRISNLLQIGTGYQKAWHCLKDAIEHHKQQLETPDPLRPDESDEAVLLSLLSLLTERPNSYKLMQVGTADSTDQ